MCSCSFALPLFAFSLQDSAVLLFHSHATSNPHFALALVFMPLKFYSSFSLHIVQVVSCIHHSIIWDMYTRYIVYSSWQILTMCIVAWLRCATEISFLHLTIFSGLYYASTSTYIACIPSSSRQSFGTPTPWRRSWSPQPFYGRDAVSYTCFCESRGWLSFLL